MRTLLNTTGTANISPFYARVASGSSLFVFLPHQHGTPAHRSKLEMRMCTYVHSPRLCTQVQYCARKWHLARVLLSVTAPRGLWISCAAQHTVHPSRQEYQKVVDVFGAVTTLNHWKLVWLPETSPWPAGDDRPVQRFVKCSPTYQHDKQKLARILMSAIRKAESTRFRTVSVIAHESCTLLLTQQVGAGHVSNTPELQGTRYCNA
jgi:hypothetical protein